MSASALDYISIYLRAAAPTLRDIEELGASAAEVARVNAVRKLHAIDQVQRAVGLPDPRIVEFFAGEGARIMATADPPAAMKAFWSTPLRRGRPGAPEDRDFEIAVEIERSLRDERLKVENAATDVQLSGRWKLDSGTLRNIYHRHKRAAKAHVAMGEMNKAAAVSNEKFEVLSQRFLRLVKAKQRKSEARIKAQLDEEKSAGRSRAVAEIRDAPKA